MTRRRRPLGALIVLAVLAAGGALARTLLSPAGTSPAVTATSAVAPLTTPPSSAPPAAHPGGLSAAAALAALPVKGRAPMTGYARALFGPAWVDVDHNLCDTRDDVLARDLVDVVLKPGGCKVATGTLHDPYTGTSIAFVRGQTTSDAVQIDHVVALANAWQTGAQQLTATTREQLANDPLELLAVDGPTNQAKGDGDAATWLPPNKTYRCTYAARQIAVKTKYTLWVTLAEHDALTRILTTCPDQALPS